MNYLAHLRLSAPNAEAVVGNMMGDFRKYLDGRALPETVERGIQNHLEVDRFTDSNPLVHELKPLFSRKRRRFAGIIIDVVFDYFLSRNWRTYSEIELQDFIVQSHGMLASKREIMPARMQLVMDYLINEGWLFSYASLEGIDNTLNRMSRRIRFENSLAGAIEEIESNHDRLEHNFRQFFPQLLNHVEAGP